MKAHLMCSISRFQSTKARLYVCAFVRFHSAFTPLSFRFHSAFIPLSYAFKRFPQAHQSVDESVGKSSAKAHFHYNCKASISVRALTMQASSPNLS